MTFQALLFCPDEKTARVTTQVLTELEFSVEACTEPFAAVKKLMGQHFDAIVVDCDNEQNASLLFKSARNSSSNQASLAVAVVEGQAGVANAFRIGANLVLTKPINVEQAKSTLRVARGLLRKGGETSKPATPPVPAAPTSVPTAEKAPLFSDLPGTSSTTSVRPAVPTPSVAKPSIPAMAAFKSQPAAPVAKAQAAPAMTQEAQKPELRDNVPEVDLFESGERSATARDQKPSAQNYPWQAASKPANLTSPTALTYAGEQKVTETPVPTAAPTSLKQAHPGFAVPVLTSGGAASAPAPAKETPKPTLPTTALEAELAIAPPALPKVPEKVHATPVPKPSIPVSIDTETAPSFSALESTDAGTGGNKTGLLIAVAVLVVAVGGYFGYAKFSGAKHSPAPIKTEQAAPTPTALASSPETITASPSMPSAAATVVASPLPTPKTQAPANTNSATSTTPKDNDAEELDVTVTHPDAAPKLVVKSGMGAKPLPKSEPNAEVAAPSLGVNEDQSAISNIVQSTTVAVPKVAVPQQTLKVSQGVTQGLLTKRVQPVYPSQAMQMHIQGAVQMLATISKEGKITSLKVLNGDPILSRAATDAVSQWRYKPYFLNGEPVEIQTQIVVNFKLP
jgi:protein TonB